LASASCIYSIKGGARETMNAERLTLCIRAWGAKMARLVLTRVHFLTQGVEVDNNGVCLPPKGYSGYREAYSMFLDTHPSKNKLTFVMRKLLFLEIVKCNLRSSLNLAPRPHGGALECVQIDQPERILWWKRRPTRQDPFKT